MSTWMEQERPHPRKRLQVVIQAIAFTPLAILTGAGVVLAVINILGGDTGYIVLLAVSGVTFAIFSYQAFHYLRDLKAEPTSTEGEITKKWTKGNLFFFFLPSYYIAVKGKIYSITRDDYRGLLEEDLVRIHHYPHTLTVESVERYDSADKKFVPAGPDGTLY